MINITNKDEIMTEADDSEKLNVKFDDKEIDKALESNEADSKVKKIAKAVLDAMKKALENFAADKAGDLIDELLLGQFKDSLIDIYKKEKLDSLSEEDAQSELAELQKNSKFKQGEERSQLDSRRDENISSEVDPASEKFSVLWYDKDKDANVGKQLNDLVIEIQKTAKKMEDDYKDLGSKLKILKVDATDDDVKNFGPVLKSLVDKKASKDEIEKKLKKLKAGVTESLCSKISVYRSSMLNENMSFVLTEDMKTSMLLESLVESDEFIEAVTMRMINEGMLDEGFLGKAFDKLSSVIPDKVKSKMKDFSMKAVKAITSKTTTAIASMAGLATGILTGGLAAELAIKAIYAVERHGKTLRNAFERQFTRFANSKGVISKMDFKIKDQKDSKYSMRFYVKDMCWRVLNTADQLKHPGKDYAKAIVDGDEGKKFRKRLAEIWDPLFDAAKGGKVDFAELFKQAQNVDIPEKALKAYQEFAENYEKIKSSCIDSPKIDTRTQSLKTDKMDK